MYYLTGPLAILEPRDQEIGESYVVHFCRTTDFESFKICEKVGRVTQLFLRKTRFDNEQRIGKIIFTENSRLPGRS